ALLVAAPAFAGARLSEVTARLVTALHARPLVTLGFVVTHFAYGALAGALFAVAAQRINVAAGLFFDLGLGGVAGAIYAPLVELGFAAAHQPALAALVLPAHLLYGGALGALAPRGEIVQPIDDAPPLSLTLADA